MNIHEMSENDVISEVSSGAKDSVMKTGPSSPQQVVTQLRNIQLVPLSPPTQEPQIVKLAVVRNQRRRRNQPSCETEPLEGNEERLDIAQSVNSSLNESKKLNVLVNTPSDQLGDAGYHESKHSFLSNLHVDSCTKTKEIKSHGSLDRGEDGSAADLKSLDACHSVRTLLPNAEIDSLPVKDNFSNNKEPLVLKPLGSNNMFDADNELESEESRKLKSEDVLLDIQANKTSILSNSEGEDVLQRNSRNEFHKCLNSSDCHTSLGEPEMINSLFNQEIKKILPTEEFRNSDKAWMVENNKCFELEKEIKGNEGETRSDVADISVADTVVLQRKPKFVSDTEVGPNAELRQALQCRSNYLSDFEIQISHSTTTEADKSILEYEKQLEEKKARRHCELKAKEPVIVNEQLSKILKERMSAVDSMVSLKQDSVASDVVMPNPRRVNEPSLVKPTLCLEDKDISDIAEDRKMKSDLVNMTGKRETDIESAGFLPKSSGVITDSSKVPLCSSDLGETMPTLEVFDSHPQESRLEQTLSEKEMWQYEPLTRKSSWAPVSSSLTVSKQVNIRPKTQPVTSKEVEKALQSSSHMTTGSDKSYFDGMPFHRFRKDSDQGDRPKSKGILKTHEHEKVPLKGILKHPGDHKEAPVKGILKVEPTSTDADSKSIHGILKHDTSASSVTERPQQGILKRDRETSSEGKTPLCGVLKKDPHLPRGTDMEELGLEKLSIEDQTLGESEIKMELISTDVNANAKDIVTICETEEQIQSEDEKKDEGKQDEEEEEDEDTEEEEEEEDVLEETEEQVEEEAEEMVFNNAANHEDVGSDIVDENDGLSSVLEDSETEEVMDRRTTKPDVARSVSHSRHLTEPTTSDEKIEAGPALRIRAENITPKSSVSDRLSALQSSSSNWKRRVEPVHDIIPGQRQKPGGVNETSPAETTDVVRRIRLTPGVTTRPESIADRLSLLKGSQEGWKSKVTAKDTEMFTVEGKMNRHGIVVSESPVTTPLRKTVTRVPASTPSEIRTNTVKIEVTPTDDTTAKEVENTPVKVEVPLVDETLFAQFFTPSSVEKTTETKVKVTIDDFDHIFMNSSDVLKTARKAVPRRTKAGSRNPVKALSQNIILQSEYTEEKTGIAERELNRLKRERVIGTPQLAQEALAGLASRENFNKVNLRKAGSFHGTGLGERHLPFKDLMLLLVKGRKWCQTRMLEPRAKSINSGDCFILVTPESVYLWIGRFSNVIEKNKSADLASQICQRHDLGVRPACQLAVLDEEKPCPTRTLNKFWTTLGETESVSPQDPGSKDEDDWYEERVNETNRVYCIHDDQLVLNPDYSHRLLRHEMLSSKEVFVFDFGSEMYAWIGKQADLEKRKKIVKLGFELWQKGYDYTNDVINPLSSSFVEKDKTTLTNSARPRWALFAKVNQNMETVLFKEKFINWPDATRLIGAKGRTSEGDGKVDLLSDLKAYDAKKMIGINRPPSVVLEGSHVGRGKTWEEMEDGIKREFEIRTHEASAWHVTEFNVQKLDPSSMGQFHSEDTYVVRWRYSIHLIARTLKGEESRQAQTGRMRCAYFFWQGQHSSINEKGASALMTVELDTERGPQVQISQGKEPPCFVNLFNGQMVIHLGKRLTKSSDPVDAWKLYIVRNELPNELYLLEIPAVAKNLRSRTSFLLLNASTGSVFVWHGAKSCDAVQKGAMLIATNLRTRCPKEFNVLVDKVVTVLELQEGSETKEFWNALEGRCSRMSYGSLLDDARSYDYTPRLFFMTSVSGTFEANEIYSPIANDIGIGSAYPFLQEDLYIEEQPALFLLDNRREIYLWQGWWAVQTPDAENVRTGSAETRFNVNRKCAMETALEYSKEINPSKPAPVYLVYAGCEPVQFTSLFPRWKPDERAVLSPSKKSPPSAGYLELATDVLASLTRKDYTFDELKERPLPEGVDPLKLEMYLAEDEFEKIVGMKRKEFADLQSWKQTEIKQKVGLF